MGEDQLGVAGDARAEFRGQREGLVEGIGVQALGTAEHGAHRLEGRAHDVVVGVLSLQRHAGGLAVGAQHQRLGVLRAEFRHDPRPQQPGSAQLCGLGEEIHADAKEERQARGKGVHVEAAFQRRADVLAPVCEGEGQLLHQRGPGFLHMVAGDRDRVEARHGLGRVGDDVADDAQAGLGGIDEGVADHELLEDVVLDGPGQLGLIRALLLPGDDEGRQHRQHRAVHGHGHRDIAQGDAVEQPPHVLDAVDGHPGLADIPAHPRVIAVITAMGGEVEGDRQTALPALERLTVEGVAFLGGRKPGVLADGPGPLGVHGRVGTAHEGRLPRLAVEVPNAVEVGSGIKGFAVVALIRHWSFARESLRLGLAQDPSKAQGQPEGRFSPLPVAFC